MDSSCGRVSRLHHHYRVIGDAAGSRGINVRKSIILQVRVPPTKRDRQPNVTAYTANITLKLLKLYMDGIILCSGKQNCWY